MSDQNLSPVDPLPAPFLANRCVARLIANVIAHEKSALSVPNASNRLVVDRKLVSFVFCIDATPLSPDYAYRG